MSIFKKLMRRFGLLSFSFDDIADAELENALHDHSRVTEAVKQAAEQRMASNAILRNALLEIKTRAHYCDSARVLVDHARQHPEHHRHPQ